MSLQGYRAGKAAAGYVDGVGDVALPADKVADLQEQALAPMALESGFDPAWVRDKLLGIMASPWVIYNKTEESLTAALAAVRELRSTVTGKLLAQNPHELRLAHEVEHQLLAMELKLEAGLNRTESRGYHYRHDYPFKDDANMLCYFTFTRNEADEENPTIDRVELKDRWKGDLTAAYEVRYPLLETPEEVDKYAVKDEKK